MTYQNKGFRNGGVRPGAGRKPKPKQPSLKLREIVVEKDLELLDINYEALFSVSREIIKRLGENPESYKNQDLIKLAKNLTSKIEKTINSYGNAHTYYLSLRYKCFERDEFTCRYCGRSPLTESVKLEADHILPKSKGGKDELNNLITSCSDCNQGKKDILLSERILVKVKNSILSQEFDSLNS
ncbi:MAG TPA: HNH endonuclease [Candidatus Babeliaceae bacterium]|nr:HNH endonuclease [Candidatus Babeliaceae bacterium]